MQRLKFVSASVIGTTTDQINKEINDGINAGETVTQIKDRIKGYFNKASNRASTIARTEITAQLNAGSIMSYEEVGVEKKEWVTNIDGFERPDHADANHQVVPITDNFLVGGEYLSAPAMGSDPANNINCRCYVVPAKE
jgi:SPP1 gp7 family putative phage head morphogenesis protein